MQVRSCGAGVVVRGVTAAVRVLGAAVLLVALGPEEGWAWGPPTHVFLATHVLSNLALFPLAVRELLSAYPYEFLYGNLSADITLAKKYVQYSRHCHHWHMGFQLFERSLDDRLRSFSLGYLCHLAGDTIAHNFFVPRQLLLTSSTRNLGHAYWEARFDTHVGAEPLKVAREVVGRDHAAPDELLESVLTQAVFSFGTNKRIFQRMIHLSNDERWQSLFVRVVAQSRWDLSQGEVERYLEVTRRFVEDLLSSGAAARACRLDPIGEENLAIAKKIRRRTIRDSRRDSGRLVDFRKHPDEVAAMADLFFPLPPPTVILASDVGDRPAGGPEGGAVATGGDSSSLLLTLDNTAVAEPRFWDRFLAPTDLSLTK